MANRNTEEGPRCVLTLSLKTEPWQEHIIEKRFAIMEHIKNQLIALVLRRIKNLERTKAYRKIDEALRNKPSDKDRKRLNREKSALVRNAKLTQFDFINDIQSKDGGKMQLHFNEHIAAQIAHTVADDLVRAVEGYLYYGRQIHFVKRGTLDSVSCKKHGNGMKYEDNVFRWSGGKGSKTVLMIPVREPNTDYEHEMLKKPIKRLRIVRKWMKNRYKYYLQITFEGNSILKDREYGTGRVGIDIGTQTTAIVSDKKVSFVRLAGMIDDNHKRICELQRKMDSSKRSMNPQNYQENGEIKRLPRGTKRVWHYSERYKRMQGKLRELQRKNADIRRYQHNILANEVLSQGNAVFVEKMNFAGLQHRAKETKKDKNGRFAKKKRFGKSLANRAPAMFITILDNKLKATGGNLHKIDTQSFRASQLDHTTGEYAKAALGARIKTLSNGDMVQRDLYSAFLLKNSNETLDASDLNLCRDSYDAFKKLHDAEINRIIENKISVPSSFGFREMRTSS